MSEQAVKRSSEVVNNVVALFLLLGGALISSAWVFFAADLTSSSDDGVYLWTLSIPWGYTPVMTIVSFGPVTLLALIGALTLRRRDGALGALVVPLLALVAGGASLLVEALALLAVGRSLQSEIPSVRPVAVFVPVLTALVGLLAVLLAHRIRSGRLLAFALVGWAFALAANLREAISNLSLVNGSDGGYYSLVENQAWSLWWLLPAVGIYLYARRAAASADSDRGRASVARIFGGLTLVGMMLTSGIFSIDEFPLAAVATLGASLVLVLLALRERATAYLWPSAVGIFAALSVINGIYFSETLGLSGALLVEGLILLGVGGTTFALRSRLVSNASNG
jgi:hypothetical protein